MDIASQPSRDTRLGNGIKWGLRGLQIVLNLSGVVICGIVISDMKKNTTWQVGTWFTIMILELILSASGIGLYLMSKLCSNEETWTFTSAAYNIIQSHVILYAYLLGTQELLHNYWRPTPKLKLTKKHYAAMAGATICQIDSIYHFIYAFFPTGPLPSKFESPQSKDNNGFEDIDPSVDKPLSENMNQSPSASIVTNIDSGTETVDSLNTASSATNSL